MLAANYNIVIDRAATFKVVIALQDDNGNIFDLSEAVDFFADIRDKATKKEVVEFIVSFVTNGSDGKVYLSLFPSQTKLLTSTRKYEYDLFMVTADRTYRLLEGDITVRNNRTNDV